VSLKSSIKNIVPKFALNWLRSIKRYLRERSDFRYDRRRYRSFSNRLWANPSILSFEELESSIFFLSHAIEKGLSLDKRRVGFGKEKSNNLVELLSKYSELGFPRSSSCFINAVSVLSEYLTFQKENGVAGIEYLEDFLKASETDKTVFGGTITLTRSGLIQDAKGDFISMSNSRHSIRAFSNMPVDMETVRKALELAQRSPSVCNRQTSRVHVVVQKSLIEKILKIQGGANGFQDSVDKLIIVTSCLKGFRGSGERNQPFVDGGIYSMNLLLALHYYGLGACTLNWDKSRKQDQRLRSIMDIPDDENVILMIAIGNLKEEFRVAFSLRKPADDVLTIHE